MNSVSFNPWNPGLASSSPQKRPSIEEARTFHQDALNTQQEGRKIGRLLELRRLVDMTLRLNPEAEGESGWTNLALEVSGEIRDQAPGILGDDGLAAALLLEMDLLDQRLRSDSPPAEVGDAKISEGDDEGSAYASYVLGMAHGLRDEIPEAIRSLTAAREASSEDREAPLLILRELLPLLFKDGKEEALIKLGRSQVQSLSMAGTRVFDLGWALHWLARCHEHEENWRECVECARESNLQLFQFGASQKTRTIGTNYYLVARGMVELDEWGEAAALAQLSLRSLSFEAEYPGRANALLVLARCLEAFDGEKPKADARGILKRLLEDRPAVSDTEKFYESAEAMLEGLGPGPVSERPGKAD